MNSSQGWWRRTYADMIEIVPRGEEKRHIASTQCACGPSVESDESTGLPMLVHRSSDGREAFELAEANMPDAYQGRLAA